MKNKTKNIFLLSVVLGVMIFASIFISAQITGHQIREGRSTQIEDTDVRVTVTDVDREGRVTAVVENIRTREKEEVSGFEGSSISTSFGTVKVGEVKPSTFFRRASVNVDIISGVSGGTDEDHSTDWYYCRPSDGACDSDATAAGVSSGGTCSGMLICVMNNIVSPDSSGPSSTRLNTNTDLSNSLVSEIRNYCSDLYSPLLNRVGIFSEGSGEPIPAEKEVCTSNGATCARLGGTNVGGCGAGAPYGSILCNI